GAGNPAAFSSIFVAGVFSWGWRGKKQQLHEPPQKSKVGMGGRVLNVLHEVSPECFAIRVARKLKAIDVIAVLSELFILRGIPAYIRSDNGPEFVAKAVQEWIAIAGAKTAYIE